MPAAIAARISGSSASRETLLLWGRKVTVKLLISDLTSCGKRVPVGGCGDAGVYAGGRQPPHSGVGLARTDRGVELAAEGKHVAVENRFDFVRQLVEQPDHPLVLG